MLLLKEQSLKELIETVVQPFSKERALIPPTMKDIVAEASVEG